MATFCRQIAVSFSSLLVLTAVALAQTDVAGILKDLGVEYTHRPDSGFQFQLNGVPVTLEQSEARIVLRTKLADRVPALEAQLDLKDSSSKQTVADFVRTFGRTIVLYKDFAASVQAVQSQPGFHKSALATKPVTVLPDVATLWINPAKWTQKLQKEPHVFEFVHSNGAVYAKVIAEKIGISTGTLRNVALTNARQMDANAAITWEQRRVVNGSPVLAMQMDAINANIPFKFFGYYHGGTKGTVQVIAFSFKETFAANRDEMASFLDGLDIHDQELQESSSASPGQMLALNNAKIELHYDPNRWHQEPPKEPGHFSFANTRGDGYALVIAERIQMSIDRLADVALENAKQADPNAKITFREKRTVGGATVWCLMMDATSKGIPFRYYGYYFSGEEGTVQVLTYTSQNLFADYEADFTEFLNGFRLAAEP